MHIKNWHNNALLSIAFEQHQLVVSQEGLLGFMKRAFGSNDKKIKASKPEYSNRHIAELKDYLGQTFASPQWVDKQTLVEGDVSAKDILGPVVNRANGTLDPLKQVSQAIATMDAEFLKLRKALTQYSRDIRPVLDMMEDGEYTKENLTKARAIIKAAGSPTKSYPVPNTYAPNGRKIKQDGDKYTLAPAPNEADGATLPALNKAQIVKVAEQLKAAVDMYLSVELTLYFELVKQYERVNAAAAGNRPEWVFAAKAIFPTSLLYDNDGFEKICTAHADLINGVCRYIDRSIK